MSLFSSVSSGRPESSQPSQRQEPDVEQRPEPTTVPGVPLQSEADISVVRQPDNAAENSVGPIGKRETNAEILTATMFLPDSVQGESTEIPSWKRILDLTIILFGLPIWLIVMIAVALWIKAVSFGPIFYRQQRVGHRGRKFMMLKFRTMKVDVETISHERYLEWLIKADSPMTKLDASGDPRIIRGGRILRAMGLDELPQLLNVLRGEMSLVGPRPCTLYEFPRYQEWQQERFNAPPGMTGYWQVHGKNKTTFTEMTQMDIAYARKMSLWLDLEIMLRTLPAVIGQLLEMHTHIVRRDNARKTVTHNTHTG
jgi:lipopolysaccharide/colanic/teichoic acid biosynthesis glycosyltransferase